MGEVEHQCWKTLPDLSIARFTSRGSGPCTRELDPQPVNLMTERSKAPFKRWCSTAGTSLAHVSSFCNWENLTNALAKVALTAVG